MHGARETSDAVAVYPRRLRVSLWLLAIAALAVASAATAIGNPRGWVGWAGLALSVPGGCLFAWRLAASGLLSRRPVLRLDRSGLHDRQTGFDVAWEEIESVAFRTWYRLAGNIRYLAIEVREPARVLARARGLRPASASHAIPDPAPVKIPLYFVATSKEELAGLIARFYDGPIEGADAPR